MKGLAIRVSSRVPGRTFWLAEHFPLVHYWVRRWVSLGWGRGMRSLLAGSSEGFTPRFAHTSCLEQIDKEPMMKYTIALRQKQPTEPGKSPGPGFILS
jgi:hypothetical protein